MRRLYVQLASGGGSVDVVLDDDVVEGRSEVVVEPSPAVAVLSVSEAEHPVRSITPAAKNPAHRRVARTAREASACAAIGGAVMRGSTREAA